MAEPEPTLYKLMEAVSMLTGACKVMLEDDETCDALQSILVDKGDPESITQYQMLEAALRAWAEVPPEWQTMLTNI